MNDHSRDDRPYEGALLAEVQPGKVDPLLKRPDPTCADSASTCSGNSALRLARNCFSIGIRSPIESPPDVNASLNLRDLPLYGLQFAREITGRFRGGIRRGRLLEFPQGSFQHRQIAPVDADRGRATAPVRLRALVVGLALLRIIRAGEVALHGSHALRAHQEVAQQVLAAINALGVLDQQPMCRLLEPAMQLWSQLFEPADTLPSHMTRFSEAIAAQ